MWPEAQGTPSRRGCVETSDSLKGVLPLILPFTISFTGVLTMLLQYAWKGFWRRRTRSLLAVLGVALSVGLVVAVVTVTRSVEGAIGSALDAAGADMVIQKRVEACPFAVVKLPPDVGAVDGDIASRLEEHPGVLEASGVLELWVFSEVEPQTPTEITFPTPRDDPMPSEGAAALPMIGGKTLLPTMTAGVDPAHRTIGPVRIATREETPEDETCCVVTRGRFLVPGDDYHVMVTEDFARARGLDVGDKFEMALEHEFEVVALVDMSGAARIGGAEAFMPLETAQELFGQGDVVATIFVSLARSRDSRAVAKYAEELIGPGVSITTEGNVEAGTAALAAVTRNTMLAVSVFVLLFALALLVRNALDNVAQRVDEVGLMKAIGWRDADVARLFVTEAAYVGVLGGLLGSIIGGGIGWAYGRIADLELPASLSYYAACATTEPLLTLPLTTDPTAFTFILGMASALFIGTIAGLAASRRAARMNPVEALRRL